MKSTKDNFSGQSGQYAQYRPVYPDDLYRFIYSKVKHFGTAWDAASGNGQVAVRLAERFGRVYATDISERQLSHAPARSNIIYRTERAEHTSFPEDGFDLITVAQALHWFDFDAFNREVLRTAKEEAVIAVWCYSLLRIAPSLDALLDEFYFHRVGAYWDGERKHVDNGYADIPFPFEPIATPAFHISALWTPAQLRGYLGSWSSVQHFIRENGYDPVAGLMDAVAARWPEGEIREVHFPLAVKAGRIIK